VATDLKIFLRIARPNFKFGVTEHQQLGSGPKTEAVSAAC